MIFTYKMYLEEVSKTIKLALPIVIAQLGVILMGVTDNIMVGRYVGKLGLGAAGIANSVSFLIASIAVGGMSVVAPLISKAKAENNDQEIQKLFKASLKVAFYFSIVLTIIGLICVVFFDIFQQSKEINHLGSQFLFYLILSNVFLFLFVGAKQLSDGLSKTTVAMYITLIGLLFNLVFNILLINGYYFFPKMGLIGSALSTLITRAIMLVALLTYLFRNKFFQTYTRIKFILPKTSDLERMIIKIGVPSGLQFFFEIAAFSLAVIMMGWLGENQLAAHQIAINVASTTYMMASGLGIAGGIRVGEGRGLHSVTKIRFSANVALALVVLFMSVMMLLILFLRDFIVRVYISDAEVIALASELMLIAAFFQLSDGVQVVALGILRGISDVSVPTWITLFAYWGISLPLGYYLGFIQNQDAIGIWIGLLLGLSVSAVLLTARFYYLSLRKNIVK